MKAEIHPEFNIDAKATCACGESFIVGSTKKEISVEICSHCHPFYTGVEKIVDTAGRVEKFKARRAAASKTPAKKAPPARASKAVGKKTPKKEN